MKLSKKDNQLKKSKKYVEWRLKVYERDSWTCQICGFRGKKIEAHHIKTFKDYPALRFMLGNGITLCFHCHRQIYGKEKLVERHFLDLLENGVNSGKLPPSNVEDNPEPSQRSDLLEGVTTRNQVFDIKRFIKKRVRCKGCGKILYRHYYRVQRSKGFVCSNKCRGAWIKKLNGKGRKHPNYKIRKPNRCKYCGKFTSTPTDRSRIKKYCDNTCQMKYERKGKTSRRFLKRKNIFKDGHIPTKTLPVKG